MKMMFQMFYTSDKLTNVFECVTFFSQFHVHCKIGTLTNRITFDSISNANSYQMTAKTTRKLSRLRKMKMMFQMFYTSDKLTNVFECVMFVSQFHVHCKIGSLTHRITFDLISNANSYQMIAKTTRKLSHVFYSSLSTNDYLKIM